MEERAMGDVAITPGYAGFWRRLVGLILDGIIVGVIGGIIYYIFNALNYPTVGYILFLIVDVGYFIWGWGRGQTLGCMALNMKLVDQQSGSAPGYTKAFVRWIILSICGFLFILEIIGGLWMLWDVRKQTWWDKAGGTLVVDA
jgi:uncharacterized RDD family membrane protein YckC